MEKIVETTILFRVRILHPLTPSSLIVNIPRIVVQCEGGFAAELQEFFELWDVLVGTDTWGRNSKTNDKAYTKL